MLPPGTYGDVVFQDNTVVTLQPGGLYQMCSFHTGQSVTVNVVPGTELRVLRNFELNQDTVFGRGAACSARVYVQGSGIGANDNAINFSKDTTVAGHFFTPNGKAEPRQRHEPVRHVLGRQHHQRLRRERRLLPAARRLPDHEVDHRSRRRVTG